MYAFLCLNLYTNGGKSSTCLSIPYYYSNILCYKLHFLKSSEEGWYMSKKSCFYSNRLLKKCSGIISKTQAISLLCFSNLDNLGYFFLIVMQSRFIQTVWHQRILLTTSNTLVSVNYNHKHLIDYKLVHFQMIMN